MWLTNRGKLKRKAVAFWEKKYDELYPKSKIIPIMDSIEINDNDSCIKFYKEKYPFYSSILQFVDEDLSKDELKNKIINELISYLDTVKSDGNILVKKGSFQSISKKKYSVEKANILEDLKMMLYEALLNKKMKQIIKVRSVNSKSLTYREYIADLNKWNTIISNLKEDNIVNKECNWSGLENGQNLSEPITQFAVFFFLLETQKIMKRPNRTQKKRVEAFSKTFNIPLTPSRYSQIKTQLKDTKEGSVHMMYYPIYKKLKVYF